MKPTTNAFHPSADPIAAVERCAAALRADRWWERAGLVEHWPLTTDEAVQLLAGPGEYDISAVELVDLVDRGLLAAPGNGESGYEWLATDVVGAAGVLEARGQWAPTPSRHDAKKHPCRLLLEQARDEGELEAVAHGGPVRFDARHLLALLRQCDIREGREKIAALLEAVLECDHGVRL